MEAKRQVTFRYESCNYDLQSCKKSISRYLLLLLATTIIVLQSNAQLLKTTSTSGGHYKSRTKQISFTIGEPVIKTLTGNNVVVTQGVNQPFLFYFILPGDTTHFAIHAFPNPTSDFTNIVVTEGELEKGCTLQVFDELGNKLSEEPMNKSVMEVSLIDQSSGIFVIKVANQYKVLQTIKIVKF